MAKSNRKTLTHDQRSQISRIAALKAHCHPTFQKQRTPSERKAIIATYKAALRVMPKWLKARAA